MGKEAMTNLATLTDRAVLEVTGEDRVSFLQGLVSQDIALAAPGRALWAALLTPQGKWLADFFVLTDGERLLLDVEAGQREMVAARLLRYRLRAKVAVVPVTLAVQVAWGGVPELGGDAIAAPDPRLPEAGWRILAEEAMPTTADATAWDRHRLSLGLPDGSRDLESEKTVLLEAGFDELGGISWTKGCYMGQELTARTRYRGLLKRRLVPVLCDGPMPAYGTPVMRDGAEVGTLRSGQGDRGLAVLRLDALRKGGLMAGEVSVEAAVPDWMRLPEAVGEA
jgi:folate-binding protein YgfZ